MLTLIKGKARKSVYMQTLHKGTINSLFVQFGTSIFFPEGLIVSRSSESKEVQTILFNELLSLFTEIIDTTDYRNVFLYGDFGIQDTGTLKDIHEKLDGRIDFTVSIHDGLVEDNTLIIEELR